MNQRVHAAAVEMEEKRLPDWKLAYRIDEACAATGYSKTKLWVLIRDRKLIAKKDGGVTLIRRCDLQAYLDSLPDARTKTAA